jgi:hypothetical protein
MLFSSSIFTVLALRLVVQEKIELDCPQPLHHHQQLTKRKKFNTL